MAEFFTPCDLMQNQVRVLLVGLGGTGSEVLSGLARLHHVMVATGHPEGLHVTAIDGDDVSPSNIGRQPFSHADIGQNKAITLITRYNLHYGLRWDVIPGFFGYGGRFIDRPFDLLITCVDKASVRVQIAKYYLDKSNSRDTLWLDTGNGKDKSQVILGHLTRHLPRHGDLRLPNVCNLFRELESVDDDAEPSCSVADALRHQDLMINRLTADIAVELLNKLLRHGRISHHGGFVDLEKMTVRPLPIDQVAWKCLGYSPG